MLNVSMLQCNTNTQPTCCQLDVQCVYRKTRDQQKAVKITFNAQECMVLTAV